MNLTWTEWERLMGFPPGWTVEGDHWQCRRPYHQRMDWKTNLRNRSIGAEKYGGGSIVTRSYNVVNTDRSVGTSISSAIALDPNTMMWIKVANAIFTKV